MGILACGKCRADVRRSCHDSVFVAHVPGERRSPHLVILSINCPCHAGSPSALSAEGHHQGRYTTVNGTAALVFGDLYRRYGLEWAITSHFGVDIVAHV